MRTHDDTVDTTDTPFDALTLDELHAELRELMRLSAPQRSLPLLESHYMKYSRLNRSER